MNLEEKANQYSIRVMNTGFEQRMPRTDFSAGYRECKSDLTEFIRANPKATAEQILKHLEDIK